MIAFVLDTDAFAAVMKNDPGVVEHLRRFLPEQIGVPQPVIGEVAYGIERLPRSKRRDALEMQFERVRSVIVRLAWTDDVSAHFGLVKAHLERSGHRIEDFDIAIAAHALSLDAVLVSADVRHMGRVPGLRVEHWTT